MFQLMFVTAEEKKNPSQFFLPVCKITALLERDQNSFFFYRQVSYHWKFKVRNLDFFLQSFSVLIVYLICRNHIGLQIEIHIVSGSVVGDHTKKQISIKYVVSWTALNLNLRGIKEPINSRLKHYLVAVCLFNPLNFVLEK